VTVQVSEVKEAGTEPPLQPSEDTALLHLALKLPASRGRGNTFLLFKPPSLLIYTAPADTLANSEPGHHCGRGQHRAWAGRSDTWLLLSVLTLIMAAMFVVFFLNTV
jgi:hypothetical protein